MTTFELLVPLAALIVAGIGSVLIRREAKKVDRLIGEKPNRQPAE
jgi:hypothetical protein